VPDDAAAPVAVEVERCETPAMDRTSPEDVGLSSARLRRIDEHLLLRYVEPGKIAGALTLVARRGKIAFLSPVGKMDRERGTPMRDDTLFRIYSMTKPVTSVALMMLHERGAFQLGDPVHKWLPGWDQLRVYRYGQYPNFVTTPAERPMTVRDLLTHTSGLSYGIMERTHLDAAYRRVGISDGKGTLSDMVDKLGQLPLEFSPGTRWGYSVATDVIARLVEILSGRRFEEYIREQIFEPLGMLDTAYTVAAEKLPRYAANYARSPDGGMTLFDDPADSAYARPKTLFTGSSGLISTAADYVRFAEMLRRGGAFGGARILGPRTVQYMTRNHLPGGVDLARIATESSFSETRFDGVGFGLGFHVVLDPVRAQVPGSVGEYGWGGMASTVFWVDPAEELTVVFMTQLVPSSALTIRSELKSLVHSAIVD
jgi:CubicO group peptidase (beta-lactamase class C family)